jgi:myo-inositol-1(or 4)-monophosphatase
LDIVSVAAGILDAHTEDLAAWDVAAAGLIATEAGALRTNLGPQRGALSPDLNGAGYFVAAPSIFQELSKLVAPAYDLAR